MNGEQGLRCVWRFAFTEKIVVTEAEAKVFREQHERMRAWLIPPLNSEPPAVGVPTRGRRRMVVSREYGVGPIDPRPRRRRLVR